MCTLRESLCEWNQNGEYLVNILFTVYAVHVNIDFSLLLKVGYPNVGKSSTINAILQAKKVPVSATPGRTKHFQVITV